MKKWIYIIILFLLAGVGIYFLLRSVKDDSLDSDILTNFMLRSDNPWSYTGDIIYDFDNGIFTKTYSSGVTAGIKQKITKKEYLIAYDKYVKKQVV